MTKKKIVLITLGVIVAIPIIIYAIFMAVLYFGMDTPKDNDAIMRSLQK